MIDTEGAAHRHEDRLRTLFAAWDRSDAPGIAVGVRHRGEVIFRHAIGMASLESPRSLSPTTGIRIGSTAKHMTAMLALLLQEEGRLVLDAPIRDYLPELSGAGGDPTLYELLQHRGGSRCYFDLSVIGHLGAMMPTGRPLALQARQMGRNFAPGTAMIYNNGGYHLISIAIERAGGAPFEDQLADRLFKPLGMMDTVSLASDLSIRPGVATLHVPVAEGGWRRGIFPTEEIKGEGGVVSTIDDMLRWTAHLVERDRFGHPDSWAKLVERPLHADGSTGRYALGLIHGRHGERPIVFHAGGVIGGLSQMLLFPDEALEIVILTNGAADADPVKLALDVANIVLHVDGGSASSDIPARELAGAWISHETGMAYTIEVDETGGKIGVAGGAATVPLSRMSDGTWQAEAVTLSRLLIDSAALEDGTIAISFGGLSASYHRPDRTPPTALPDGTWRSHDADCDARLVRRGDGDFLTIDDGLGGNCLRLDWLDQRMALATATDPALPYTAVLLLEGDGSGFTLNTARTRWLTFKQHEPM